MSTVTKTSAKQRVIVAINPDHALAIVCEDGKVVADSTPHGGYIGMSEDDAYGGMISVMRYEDGSEPQPNSSGSANGYARIIEIDGAVGDYRWALWAKVTV